MIRVRLISLAFALSVHLGAAAAPQCGNALLDSGETCDDGNSVGGDGCSSSCQVESGYECTDPIPPAENNAVINGGFEAGSTPVGWTENAYPFPTLVCSDFCGIDSSLGARSGEQWVWLGGASVPVQHWVQQQVPIQSADETLSFWFKVPGCNASSPNDYFNLTIDGNEVFRVQVDSPLNPLCDDLETYHFETIDLTSPSNGGPYNDGANHAIRFNARQYGSSATSFFLDDVSIARGGSEPIPSVCTAFDSCLDEGFDSGTGGLPADWSAFESDRFSLPWGTTDSEACNAGNASSNFTGGAGEAACIDSNGYNKQTSSYLCSGPVDLTTAVGSRLQFVFNYQVKTPGPDDRFDVLVGTAAPGPDTIGGYSNLFPAGGGDHGSPFRTPGEEKIIDLAGFEGSTVHVCFHYGAMDDWYAQVDDVEVRADSCGVSGPPPAPGGVSASDGSFADFVRIDWGDVASETGYQVFRCGNSNTSSCELIAQEPANVPSHDDYGADPGGASHFYRVKACNAHGCSPYSGADTGFRQAVPAAPSTIDASDGAYLDFVRVTWSEVTGAGEYRLYRCADAANTGSCAQFATRPSGTTSLDDTGADAGGATHYYRAKACNAAGCSAYSPADAGFRDSLNPPPVPVGVSASDGTFVEFVRVSWTDGPDEDSYQVFRCTAPNTSCFLIEPTGANVSSFDDTTADPGGGLHYYQVRACNFDGCSALSLADSGYRQQPIQPPSTPGGIAASDGTHPDKVRVSWSDVAAEDEYLIYRCANGSDTGSCSALGQSAANATSYDDFSAAEDGTVHFYRVRACNEGGCSGYSAADGGYRTPPAPDAPSGVQASDGAYPDKVRIAWNDVSEEDEYRLFRCGDALDTGTCGMIGTVAADTVGFDDTGADENGTEHHYRVRACNQGGCSAYSAADAGFRLAAPPVPENVSASDGVYTDRVEVSWSDGSAEDGYDVFRCSSADPGSCGDPVGSVGADATVFDDFGADPDGATHHYRVRACNAAGCSLASAADSGHRARPAPDAPGAVQASDAVYTDRVRISWGDVASEDEYLVFRCGNAANTGSCDTISTLPADAMSYDDFGADESGATHYYRVRACNESGCSAYSDADGGSRKVTPTGDRIFGASFEGIPD